MTFCANRLNIKPMLRLIVGMMVILCLFGAVFALQSVGAGQFASFNSKHYSVICFYPLWIFPSIILHCSLMAFFCFFGFGVLFHILFHVRLEVFFIASLTSPLIATFCSMFFVKARKGFVFFAFTTAFCYDLLRHDLFLLKRGYCFEPLQGRSLCGSFYFNIRKEFVK